MNQINRRGILRFLGMAPVAAVPASAVAASAQPPSSPLDSMSFEECRYLWNEHLSLARKSMNAAATEVRIKESDALGREAQNHMKRYSEIYKFAVRKFGDVLPRSLDGDQQ